MQCLSPCLANCAWVCGRVRCTAEPSRKIVDGVVAMSLTEVAYFWDRGCFRVNFFLLVWISIAACCVLRRRFLFSMVAVRYQPIVFSARSSAFRFKSKLLLFCLFVFVVTSSIFSIDWFLCAFPQKACFRINSTLCVFVFVCSCYLLLIVQVIVAQFLGSVLTRVFLGFFLEPEYCFDRLFFLLLHGTKIDIRACIVSLAVRRRNHVVMERSRRTAYTGNVRSSKPLTVRFCFAFVFCDRFFRIDSQAGCYFNSTFFVLASSLSNR